MLTEEERELVDLRLQGYSASEVAEEKGTDTAAVDAAVAKSLGPEGDLDVARIEALLVVVFPMALSGDLEAVEKATALIAAKRTIEKGTVPRAPESMKELLERN